jgi:prepilin-type processing-associated H-X9-DG protein
MVVMVVIVIIVVLAAMSFMGASRMKEKARSAVCASNIRQVGMAMLSYTSDNQNKLPPLAKIDPRTGKQSGIWTLVLARDGYLWDPQTPGTPRLNEGVWACPECTESSNITHMGYGIAEATVIQYDDRVSRANTRLGKTEFGSLRLSSIKNPSRTWLLGDAALKPDKLEESWYAVWSNPTKWGSGHTPAERHGGKVNVCMVDGHVESLTIDQIKEGNYTLDQ